MSTRRSIAALMVGVAAASSGCTTSKLLIDAELVRTNTHTVLAFEETVFNKHHVRDGFDRYVGPGFMQHSATLPDERDATIALLTRMLTSEYPASRLTVERTVAQGDLVAVQALWRPRPAEAHSVARVDIYRLLGGRIVEHWDVTQGDAQAPPQGAPDKSASQ